MAATALLKTQNKSRYEVTKLGFLWKKLKFSAYRLISYHKSNKMGKSNFASWLSDHMAFRKYCKFLLTPKFDVLQSTNSKFC